MNIVRIYLKEGVQSPKAFICSTYESYARIFTHTYLYICTYMNQANPTTRHFSVPRTI